MTHKEKAKKLFLNGANCSQSVFAEFSDITGIDENTAMLISSSFGGGMGHLGEVCGALTGAFMAAGALYGYAENGGPEAKENHYKLIRRMANSFKETYCTILCRDLKISFANSKYDNIIPNSEDYKKRPCLIFVEKAVDILEDVIDKHN